MRLLRPAHFFGLLFFSMLAPGCLAEAERTDAPENSPPEARSDEAAGPSPTAEGEGERRARLCPPVQSATALPQEAGAGLGGASMTFPELSHAVVSACRDCHLAPAGKTGGFTFLGEYRGREMIIEGARVFVPGLFEAGERMARALVEGRMPPPPLRDADPASAQALGAALQAWIGAGRPEGEFPLHSASSDDASAPLDEAIAERSSDLGDCVPSPELIGVDLEADRAFATRDSLPERLEDTDLFTLDAYALAQRGTVAYNVEYPLWADNAEKGRWVHVPHDPESPGRPRAITFDPETRKFRIPDNTRFYKTFYKEVRKKDGSVRFRKVETRLIVTRSAPATPLFGTYVWSADERSARLQTTPYRDGTPWKDRLISLETDEATGARRDYAVPAKHRCVECHMGSESQSFVLGFTPLQINRRAPGEAGREGAVGPSERSQVERLLAYGVVRGFEGASALPVLERSKPGVEPRSVFELRAQGYVLGNCAHCHSAEGYATRQNSDLARLDFSPGGSMFQFDSNLTSAYGAARYVRPTGRPLDSLIYQRLAQKVTTGLSEVGPLVRMPLHTPGAPDCRALRIMGQWLVSLPRAAIPGQPTAEERAAAERAAAAFEPECTEGASELEWVEEDFTEPAGPYVPRRADWNDPVDGMGERFRSLELDPGLAEVARTDLPIGYWRKKEACSFPEVSEPEEGVRPWMLDAAGRPKRPFGEIYRTTPGAWYFTTSCSKCHGPEGAGNGGLAKSLLVLSGGQVRVANLMAGLFGEGGRNLETFQVTEVDGRTRNLAGPYLIWMAMEGTRVEFPPEIQPFLGPHGATMLHRIRERCARLLPGASARFVPRFEEYEVYARVCTFGNPMDDPALGFSASGAPIDSARQNAWLDRAAMNAGWTIFEFLKDRGAQGLWPTPKDRCESVFPTTSSRAVARSDGGRERAP